MKAVKELLAELEITTVAEAAEVVFYGAMMAGFIYMSSILIQIFG